MVCHPLTDKITRLFRDFVKKKFFGVLESECKIEFSQRGINLRRHFQDRDAQSQHVLVWGLDTFRLPKRRGQPNDIFRNKKADLNSRGSIQSSAHTVGI